MDRKNYIWLFAILLLLLFTIVGSTFVGVAIKSNEEWWEQTPLLWIGAALLILAGIVLFGMIAYGCLRCIVEDNNISTMTGACTDCSFIGFIVLLYILACVGAMLTAFGQKGSTGQQIPEIYWTGVGLLSFGGFLVLSAIVYIFIYTKTSGLLFDRERR